VITLRQVFSTATPELRPMPYSRTGLRACPASLSMHPRGSEAPRTLYWSTSWNSHLRTAKRERHDVPAAVPHEGLGPRAFVTSKAGRQLVTLHVSTEDIRLVSMRRRPASPSVGDRAKKVGPCEHLVHPRRSYRIVHPSAPRIEWQMVKELPMEAPGGKHAGEKLAANTSLDPAQS
jgi:hypothetical protein